MGQNVYDKKSFFDKYGQMRRSIEGLSGAGEWETLKKLLPNFKNKKVLDLGCGFGWHCQYAIEHGASSVVGTDISKKMLDVAKEKTSKSIKYELTSIEEVEFPKYSFDIVISSLAFHYLKSFNKVAKKIYGWLKSGGVFIFSVEHPVFTSEGSQDWYRDSKGHILHFPVDRYFEEGKRETKFLGETVNKYHRTLTTYISDLTNSGFQVTAVVEPKPSNAMINEMKDELRRPMMLIVSAIKS